MTASFSHNDSFKFGYNDIWFNFRTSIEDKWRVSYDPISRQPLDFKNECINTAKLIRDSTTLPLDVLFSGGKDSEITVDSFVEAKIPINVIIMKFKDNYNAHDINYAFKYCDSKGITPTVIELDVLDFLKKDAYDYARKTYCVSPILLPHMWLIDQCDNYIVIGSGDPFLYKNVSTKFGQIPDAEWWTIGINLFQSQSQFDSKWYYREGELVASINRHLLLCNRDACPGFFQFTPEIVLSFLTEKEILRDIADDSKKVSTFYSKYDMYDRFWDLQWRPKFDGFEVIRSAINIPNFRKELEELYIGCKQVCSIEYNGIIDMLNGS